MSEQLSKGTRILERAEHHIYLAAGYILVFAAAGLLVTAIIDMIHEIRRGEYVLAMVHLLDRVLLALMLAEIIYTVGRIARTQKLETAPFLIVAIIAAVRRMLIITAESTEHMDFANPEFQAAMAELGLLAIMIFLLAWSMRLLGERRNEQEPR
jgi:uncharacterized membrane protein (DUF373 family)